jgi:prefoldin subunit 5
LRSRREELSNQLTNVTSRRRRIADEMNQTPAGAARTGLEQRLAVLDERIAQMESDLAATGKQLSAAPLGLIASTEEPMQGGDIPDNVMTMIGVFTVFVLFPIAIAVSRFIWRRAGKVQVATVQLPQQVDQRLERLEQGVDAIAIEIERVTEGQRFVTKLLSESQQSLTRLSEARVPAERE